MAEQEGPASPPPPMAPGPYDPPVPPAPPAPFDPVPPPGQPPAARPGLAPPLTAAPLGTGRAVTAAVLLIVLSAVPIVIFTAVAVASGWTLSETTQGIAFVSLSLLGYGLAFMVAVALTRVRGFSFADTYGLHGLGWVGLALGVGVSLVARLLGAAWTSAVQWSGIELPGMEAADPTRFLPTDPVGIALAVLVFAIVAPLVEEIVFRGMVMASLTRRTTAKRANLYSSLLFAALHLNLFTFVPIFLASLGFGWVFARTRTLWAAFVAHAAFNGLALIATYALQATGQL